MMTGSLDGITIRLIGLPVFQHPEKHLLGQIFAQRAVRGQVLEIAEHARVVPVEEHFQPGDVAFADILHAHFVLH